MTKKSQTVPVLEEENVASAGGTHCASEISTLEFLVVRPKNANAPLSDTECHLQGGQDLGALGEHKVFQSTRSLLQPTLRCAGSRRAVGQASQNQSILPVLQKLPPPQSL